MTVKERETVQKRQSQSSVTELQEHGIIRIKDNHIPFAVRRNKRSRRIRLVMSPEEGLVIEGPHKVNLSRAFKMITTKREWVLNNLENIREKQKSILDIKTYADSILLFGTEKRIIIIRECQNDRIIERDHHIELHFKAGKLKQGEASERLTAWLKRKAKKYLVERVAELNDERFTIKRVFVKDQKTLWGSCSSSHNLNFNWRLIMAPRFASDYIIFHEMCHTKHLNHSEKFWELVKSTCPHYERAESWFEKYGFILHIPPRLS